MSGTKILVTGANGLLGRLVVDKLSQEHQVTAVVRNRPAEQNNYVNYLVLDLSRDWDTDLLPSDTEVIIHLAQSNNYKNFPESALEVFNVNLSSTIKLLDFGKRVGINRFILASTGGLYVQRKLPLNEDSQLFAPDRMSHYLGTKLSAEIFSSNYRPFFHVDILRIFFMYGPRQKINMLIPRIISSVKNKIPITLSGSTGIRINPIFVDDVASVIQERVHSTDSQVFNVAGADVVSLREIAETIGRNLGITPQFEFLGSQPDLVSNIDKCSSILNGNITPLEVGLTHTCDWFKFIDQ